MEVLETIFYLRTFGINFIIKVFNLSCYPRVECMSGEYAAGVGEHLLAPGGLWHSTALCSLLDYHVHCSALCHVVCCGISKSYILDFLFIK